MEVQLQELVEKIKKDGIETASAQAAGIVRDAESKAATIIKAARDEADAIVKKGQDEASRMEKAAVSAISQAGRNLILSFRDSILSTVDSIIKTETSKVYDSSVLQDLVPASVKAWIASPNTNDLTVLLSPADAEKLDAVFKTALKNEIAKGLEVKADKAVSGGFRIGTKDGAAYYDFSAEAVASLFSEYLNPRIAAIMKDAAKEL